MKFDSMKSIQNWPYLFLFFIFVFFFIEVNLHFAIHKEVFQDSLMLDGIFHDKTFSMEFQVYHEKALNWCQSNVVSRWLNLSCFLLESQLKLLKRKEKLILFEVKWIFHVEYLWHQNKLRIFLQISNKKRIEYLQMTTKGYPIFFTVLSHQWKFQKPFQFEAFDRIS
jgi:hypothetical protein